MMNTTETHEYAAAATFSTSTSARSANGDIGRFRPIKSAHDSWERSWFRTTIAKPGQFMLMMEDKNPRHIRYDLSRRQVYTQLLHAKNNHSGAPPRTHSITVLTLMDHSFINLPTDLPTIERRMIPKHSLLLHTILHIILLPPSAVPWPPFNPNNLHPTSPSPPSPSNSSSKFSPTFPTLQPTASEPSVSLVPPSTALLCNTKTLLSARSRRSKHFVSNFNFFRVW